MRNTKTQIGILLALGLSATQVPNAILLVVCMPSKTLLLATCFCQAQERPDAGKSRK